MNARSQDPPASAARTEPPHAPAPGARGDAGLFTWPVRIYYEDTDAGGVVYYANYLRFFERCRSEWMRALGYGQRQMLERDGVLFVVAGLEIKYLRPARLDDELVIDARIGAQYSSYVVFEQQAWRGSELLARTSVKVACVGAQTLRPTRLPAGLLAWLSELPGKNE
jgi:acyl-CoA thioester hydrolase